MPVDPVCGIEMEEKLALVHEYDGKKYHLKKLNNILIDYIENIIVPVDPVCGIEMDESLALVHEYEGKKYHFCCNGCKRIFLKKPKKYKKNT